MNFNPNPRTMLSIFLALLALTPLLNFVAPLLTPPNLKTLLPIFDHLTAAAFATRYLTFATGLEPTSLNTLYPYILPCLPLLQLSAQLFTSSKSIAEVILPFSNTPKPDYNPCQARFSIFLSTVLGTPLIILQAVYGVPRGVSHYIGLVLPCLLIVSREGFSWLTVVIMALVAWLGNVAVLGYLLCYAAQALLKDLSLARLLLAPRGDLPDKDAESVEEEPLLGNRDPAINQ